MIRRMILPLSLLLSGPQRAQPLDMRYELIMLFTVDLVVDAGLVRTDEAHIWVRVNSVLNDERFGIVNGDYLRVDRGASIDCGYPWSLGNDRRWRLYLQKEEGKGRWALQERDAASAVPIRNGTTSLYMPAGIELTASEMNRCLIEFRSCYAIVDSSLDFTLNTARSRLDSLASGNPVITRLEAQGRTIDPVRVVPEPVGIKPLALFPTPLLECALIEQRPTTSADEPMETLFAERLPDPTPAIIDGNRVILRALIDTSGNWHQPELVKGSTLERDNAAMKFAEQLPRVKPARRHGKAVPCLFTFPVRFEDHE